MRRLSSAGKSGTRYHVKDMRGIMENHLFTDPMAKIKLSELKRAHVLDFRELLIEKLGYTRTVQKTVSVLKTIVKEAYFREVIGRDPTAGIGISRYQPKEIDTFTVEEFRALFPPKPPGPWKDIYDYTGYRYTVFGKGRSIWRSATRTEAGSAEPGGQSDLPRL